MTTSAEGNDSTQPLPLPATPQSPTDAGLGVPPSSPAPSSRKRTIRRPQRYVKDEQGEGQEDDNEEDSTTGGEEDGDVDEWGDLELVKCPSHFCDTCHDIYVSPSSPSASARP